MLLCVGCEKTQPRSDRADTIAEVNFRENSFKDYPREDTTYLSFSRAHGFQVNYLAPQGRAWLWYPGNLRGVPEEYKKDVISGLQAICWRHPENSFNPVTRRSGGGFACENLSFAQKTIVAALPGDPFNLKTGQVPYRLDRCTAPTRFQFERSAFSC